MVIDQRQNSWAALAASVTGASHVRSGSENQDAVVSQPIETSHGLGHLIAVADGHGSARSPRSARGAAIAVRIARDVVADGFEGIWSENEVGSDAARARIARVIVERWREAVLADVRCEPMSRERIEYENQDTGLDEDADAVDLLAYGTTLLVVAVAGDHLACWQIGDGDMLLLHDDGEVALLVPGDPRLLGNATTSLSADAAENDFRSSKSYLGDRCAALLLIATDGYRNSFRNGDGLHEAARDFAGLLRERGADYVHAQLKAWLTETTTLGSGDDITVALIHRINRSVTPAGEQGAAG